ncbi:MAG: DUF2029 domain-containing protein [Planctomycetes bacterium]|nr:DUF2029 domain-containing protein [Planctomycetota bacterium]
MRNWLLDRRVVAALPWACGLVAFALAAKNLIGTHADLGIYLDTARELREGGVDLFRARPDSGPWAYPPVAVLPFAGLQLLCSDAVIRWLWCIGLGFATTLLVLDSRKIAERIGGLRWWQWLCLAVLFQRTIAQNLTHGQLSLWVAVALLRGLRALLERRDGAAGTWLAVATALKLTPALFLFALPLMRRTRAATVMALVLAFLVLLLPWPFLGAAEHSRHLTDFHRAIVAPMLGSGERVVTEFAAGSSINGALDYLLRARPTSAQGHTVHWVDLAPDTVRTVKLTWSLLLGALLLGWGLRARRLPDAERLTQQFGAVAMAIVLFSPITRLYHLAGAWVAFLLFCRGPRPRIWLWAPIALTLLLAMTLRQRKLLGEAAWRAFEIGPLHLALVGMSLWACLACRAIAPPDPDGEVAGRP